jgi:hypothetical protein
MALEALEYIYGVRPGKVDTRTAIEALRAALAQPEPEPVLSGLPMVIAGAIFDFGGFLTTRDNVVEIGATANASSMVELIKEWAALRGLSLDDAAVLSWQETIKPDYAPPQREWQGLTDEEFNEAIDGLEDLADCWMAIEAKLKEKNG